MVRLGLVGEWFEFLPRLSFIIATFKYLLFNKFDIIHAFPFIAGIPAFFAGFLSKTPVIFSVFALNGIVEKVITFYIPYQLLITDNFDLYKNNFSKRMVYVPNGVDIKLFDGVKIKKSKYPRILFVGRFHPQKGVMTLLKAIPNLRKKIPNIKFVLIGYGILKKNIEKFISKNNLFNWVEVKSPVIGENLVKEYKQSYLLVLPSLYEGGGIVVLEAWAAKIPVITTAVGSLKYIVKDGINGYLIKSHSSQKLARAIYKMIMNKQEKKMGENGYYLVKSEYTWKKSVDKLYEVYRTLL